MRHKRRATLWALVTLAVGVIVPSAWAFTVTMTAETSLKRTHSWQIEKSVSQPAVTLKKGESATVNYSVTVGPAGAPVDSDFAVAGTMEMSDTPDITIGSVVFQILPEETVASHECVPASFPVELGLQGLQCTYSASLPDAADRTAFMRAEVTTPEGGRIVTRPIDFDTATVDEVDECVAVTDSVAGDLGTVCAADAPKTFTYSTTIGPFDECGTKTVDNVASYETNDTGATGGAGASVAVTVTGCEPPRPKCPLPSLVWKFVGVVGPSHVKSLLPITLGTPGGSKTVVVSSTLHALIVLGAEWYSSNVVAHLSTELLAARLNEAAGRDVSSIASAMAAADAFLAAKSAYSYLSSTEKAHAKSLTAELEAYNNKCIPDFGHGDHDWCKRHWDKPDHDWHKWNWKKFDWDD